jgi:hypothetical protein
MPGVTAREDRLTIALIALAVAVGAFALGFVAIIFGGDGDDPERFSRRVSRAGDAQGAVLG